MLLLTETLIVTLVISGLCQVPPQWHDRAGACVATLMVLPCAIIISPLACLAILVAGVRVLKGSQTEATKSGGIVSSLRLGAWWNAASLPNALVAQAVFVPLALDEASGGFRAALLVLLPTCLIVTKLMISQAFKALAVSVGVTESVWAVLRGE